MLGVHTKARPGCGATFGGQSLLQSRVITVLPTVPSASKCLLIERFSNFVFDGPYTLYCYLSRSKVALLNFPGSQSREKD